jgi:hypothetical protein
VCGEIARDSVSDAQHDRQGGEVWFFRIELHSIHQNEHGDSQSAVTLRDVSAAIVDLGADL